MVLYFGGWDVYRRCDGGTGPPKSKSGSLFCLTMDGALRSPEQHSHSLCHEDCDYACLVKGIKSARHSGEPKFPYSLNVAHHSFGHMCCGLFQVESGKNTVVQQRKRWMCDFHFCQVCDLGLQPSHPLYCFVQHVLCRAYLRRVEQSC